MKESKISIEQINKTVDRIKRIRTIVLTNNNTFLAGFLAEIKSSQMQMRNKKFGIMFPCVTMIMKCVK